MGIYIILRKTKEGKYIKKFKKNLNLLLDKGYEFEDLVYF